MMAEIRFYHLQNQSLEQVLPALLTKAWQNGHRIVVQDGDAARLERLNDLLWTYNPDSFLPHGSKTDGEAEHQPIWLTAEEENPNGADVLIVLDGRNAEKSEDFTLICDMFDGRDAQAVKAARARWKDYKDKGLNLTYWQQNERGGWEKNA